MGRCSFLKTVNTRMLFLKGYFQSQCRHIWCFHCSKTHSWYSELNFLQNVYLRFVIFWTLTGWRHSVSCPPPKILTVPIKNRLVVPVRPCCGGGQWQPVGRWCRQRVYPWAREGSGCVKSQTYQGAATKSNLVAFHRSSMWSLHQKRAKDGEVRGKPLQLGRTYHRRTLRETKTTGKVTENHPGKYVRLWVCSRIILRCRHAIMAPHLEYHS